MTLHPCPRCARHVADARCPFCGAEQPARPPHRTLRGRLSRAAVFGAALAAPGCWTDAASGKSTTQVEAKAEGTIEGVLTSSDSGEAVAGQRVTLQSSGTQPRYAMTDAQGRYKFTNVAPGDYVLVFAQPRGPRGPRNMTTVQVLGSETQHVNWEMVFAERTPIPMPYGAPPMRRRRV